MWGLGDSGGERVIYEIAKELAREGFDVRIISHVSWGFKGDNKSVSSLEGVKVFVKPRLFRPLISIFYLMQFDRKRNHYLYSCHFFL
jgi:hypothetical protein